MKETRLFINNTRITNLKQLAENFKDDDVREAYKSGTLMSFLTESYPREAAALEEKVGKDLKGEELLQAIIDALGLDKSAIEKARKKAQSKELKLLEKKAEEFFRDEEYDSAVKRSEHIEWKFPSQSAVAQRILGLCHLAGNGTYRDVNKALTLLKNAADRNDINAQVALACIYLLGLDIALPNNTTIKSQYKNEEKAVGYFLSPEVQKSKDIVSNVVDYCEKTMGKKNGEVFYTVADLFKQQNNNDEFIYYLTKAAVERHHPDAQFTMGCICLKAKDKKRAKYWLKHAADQGHTRAREILSAIETEQTEPWANRALYAAIILLMSIWGPKWMFPKRQWYQFWK